MSRTAAQKKWYEDNKAKVLADTKAWKAANRERHLEHGRTYRASHPDRKQTYRLKHDYKITVEEYNRLFQEQEGRCRICKRHQSELQVALCVDHDHETEEVRGLLCTRCNLILGNAKDDKEVLLSAVKYLNETSSKKQPPVLTLVE